ncbi:hypothetical protein H2248_004415 [Termitomyces sp. 'cryptogamus']|nr:hypothetical protein H2248_004415 [Termitomyces sp. 'cryptogamus']
MENAMKSLSTFLRYSHTLLLFLLCVIVPSSLTHAHQYSVSHLGSGHTVPAQYGSRAVVFPPSYSKKMKARSESLDTLYERRVRNIIGSVAVDPNRNISGWFSTLDDDGKWPDSEVDYTTGCDARRANWPAQEHWRRIVLMAAAWHGGLNHSEQYTGDEKLRSKTSDAMDYWYSRDFTDLACLDSGGTEGSSCTCENPDNLLWNTNWFSNVILIPKFATSASLLLKNTLTSSQVEAVKQMATRSYEYNVDGMTGANALDVARIGMDFALLTIDIDWLADAYDRSHKELIIMDDVRADGIRADGAFGQHDGILYNGNYGKDYSNDILGDEIEAAGSDFAADAVGQAAFETLFEGNRWMITRNTITQTLHWDLSVIGRFITFPVADINGATNGIKINLTAVGELGQLWKSQKLLDVAKTLSAPSNVNAGGLIGNRMFYTNDYMVHRGKNYTSTLKLWSTRTRHTECTNSQNPLGFHLADGVTYNYIRGDEYEDIAAAWDWNLISGITTDYGATPLTCDNTKLLGLETFVGGASDGKIGVAAMRYTNPVTKKLKWQKAWFYLESDIQHVMVSNLTGATIQSPAISVLDQRRHNGPIIVDGSPISASTYSYSAARTLWHGGVGYRFAKAGAALYIDVGVKTGDWSKIGTTSEPPLMSIDLFAAWIKHQGADASSLSYTVFPGTTAESFASRAAKTKIRSVQKNAHISAVVDDTQDNGILMAVFWDATGGAFTYEPNTTCASLTVAVNGNTAFIYRTHTGLITLSDPSQQLTSIQVTLTLGEGSAPPWWSGARKKTLVFSLPESGLAGSSLTQKV